MRALNGDEVQHIDLLNGQKSKLMHMMQTEGWQLVAEMLKQKSGEAYQQMALATDAWNGGKHMGAWHALEFFRVWPESQIDLINKQIQLIQQQALQR